MVRMVQITPSRRLAAVITASLDEAGITQRQAADRAGIPRPTLARRLASGAGFTIDEVERLAELLNTTALELMREATQAA